MNVEPSPAIEALVVDFGGVLTTPLRDAMRAFADEEGIAFEDVVRAALPAYTGDHDPLVTDFETGRISEEEFALAFAGRLTEISGRAVSPRGIVGRLFRVRLEDDMLGAVSAARRAGFKTGLLSNSWGMGLYPKERLADLFDAVVISGEVGFRKPEPQIFHLTADRLGVAMQACVFVDDHPGHLKAALGQGMKTVLHRSPPETIGELEALLEVPLRPGQR